MAPLQGLIWIAKMPQGPGCIGEAMHPGSAVLDGEARVLLGVIQSNPLLQVWLRRGQLSQTEQGEP